MAESQISYTLTALLIFALLAAFCAQTTFADGSIIGWGSQVVGVDLSSGFVKVADGGYHSLGLKQDGSIVAWGWNGYGQCNSLRPIAALSPSLLAIIIRSG